MSAAPEGTCTVSQNVPSRLPVSIQPWYSPCPEYFCLSTRRVHSLNPGRCGSNLKVSFSNSFYRTITRASAVRWFLGECHRPSLMKINWCNCYIHEYYTANSLRTVFETIPEACTTRVSERSWILYLIWMTIYPVLYLNQLATEEILNLTHWGRDKMAAIFQTTFSNAFSWIKSHEFWLRFQWSLFLRVQLIIFEHWFR